jgi:putative oxidoreductase
MLPILLALLARLSLVLLFFPFSALDKVLNFGLAVKQAEAHASPSLARLLILCGLGVEVIMSLGVLTGVADRFAALVLALYCVVTAVLWKQFWSEPDFRLVGASKGREVFWDFLKNLAVAGGFLMLSFGASAASVQAFLDAPFASHRPYQLGDR